MNKFDPKITTIQLGVGKPMLGTVEQKARLSFYVGTYTRRVIRYNNLSLTRKVRHRHKVVLEYDFETPLKLSPEFLARYGLSSKESS